MKCQAGTPNFLRQNQNKKVGPGQGGPMGPGPGTLMERAQDPGPLWARTLGPYEPWPWARGPMGLDLKEEWGLT